MRKEVLKFARLLSLATCFAPMEFFCNEAILINYGRGGGPEVCKILSLDTCFCCNGTFLSFSLITVREEVLKFARI